MKFASVQKVILFGGAPLLVAAARRLKEDGMAVRIYTSPRHAVEVIGPAGLTLAGALRELDLPFVETEDIKSETGLIDEILPGTLGLGFGQAWSFSPEIIQRFDGHLLDFMGIPHPRYRGGAHYTWMILKGDRVGGCNLQVITPATVQGEFDDGDIVKSCNYEFPAAARIPNDYFAAAVPHEVAFIQEFISEVKAGKEFSLQRPDESRSLFLPRLNTMKHGWINWSWDGQAIERFIGAFDEPYAGASTRLGSQRVHLKGARLGDTEERFHPFQSGLVTRITPDEGYCIATSSGHLKVSVIAPSPGETLLRPPVVGDRLTTPLVDLESASDRISYGSVV